MPDRECVKEHKKRGVIVYLIGVAVITAAIVLYS